MVNQGTLLGRVGTIETKPMNNGQTVTNISMVTSKKFVKDGQKQEKVTWHNVTMFSKLSEIAEKYIAKGDLLYIQGEMDTQKYTGKDGIERSKSFIIAHELKLMPRAKEMPPESKQKAHYAAEFDDSEVPF